MDIYHQLGWRHQWNIQSLHEDSAGDGVIIAPRYLDITKTSELVPELKRNSLFDPQFFIPGYPKGNLATYQFFPDVLTDGYVTSEFSFEDASKVAEKCVQFQINNEFEHIIIPARYIIGNPDKYISAQQNFLNPFLNEIKKLKPDKKTYLQLVLNDSLIKDEDYSSTILNWVTSIKGIDGVYLITEVSKRSKQIKDIDFLYSLLRFIHSLSSLNLLDVVLGYLNVESLLLSIASPTAVTIGSYENTKMFDIRNFEEEQEKRIMSQPIPRIYMSKLLQIMDYRYIGSINDLQMVGESLFDNNKYQAEMFEPTFNWNFQKPEIYKHYFLEISKQIRELSVLDGKDRYNKFESFAMFALENYQSLDDQGIIFDANSDGSHLASWLTAANRFAKEMNWR